MWRYLLAALLFAAVIHNSNGSQAASPGPTAAGGLITVQNGQFVDALCKPFVFSGANVGELLEAAAGISGSPSDVGTLFSTAKSQGLNVVRFFPQGITPALQLQTAPGQYNPTALQALDSIVSQAAAADVKLIMPFANNWQYSEGKLQYVDWAGGQGPESFYTDANVKNLYKAHIKFLTSRYLNEPAILAWDLINEPRAACDITAQNASCLPSATENIQAWIEEISAYVKQQDPNHLVTVGEEGFYAASDAANAKAYNPNADGTGWASKTGQNFVENHTPSSIDFAAIHIWPDNWQSNTSFCGGGNPSCGSQFVSNWLTAHAADASSLQKPLVVEEFGTGPASRTSLFGTIYQAYEGSLSSGNILKGVAFWEWEWVTDLSAEEQYSSPLQWVQTGDSTWTGEVQPSLAATQQTLANGTAVANCVAGTTKASSLLPVESFSGGSTTGGRRMLAVRRSTSPAE